MTLIAQISDLHLRPRGVPCYRVVETNMMSERAVDALLALDPRPDAVIVTGDITDTGDPREHALARELLDRLPMPVLLLAGNHDESPALKAAFDGYPGMDHGPADRLRWAVDIGDLRLVGLDSSVPGAGHGELGAEQLAWLEDTLAGASGTPTIVAVHHPPIVTGIGHMDAINLRDADALAEVLRRHDQVARVICGHDHRSIIAGFAGTIVAIAPGVAHQVVLDLRPDGPSRFNLEPPAYFLHDWSAAAGLVTHTAYVEKAPGPYPFWPAQGVVWPG